MKRKILSVVGCLLLGVATAMASNVLVIHLTSGVTERFILLNEEPTINFSGNNNVVTTATTEHTYPMEAVNYFNYETSDATAIEGVTSNGMSMQGDRIAFSGLPAGSAVFLYGAGGQLYMKTEADADGNAAIDLTSLMRGVYIVKANNVTTKITKK